jgi:formate dehydrogenase subunit delta
MTPVDKLVMMANQIARNFAVEGDVAAAEATADHLARFWDPTMRARLSEHAARGGNGLSPIARAALGRLQHAASGG